MRPALHTGLGTALSMLALLAAGCGAGSAPTAVPTQAAQVLPTCAGAAQSIAVSSAFPSNVPLPPGLVVTAQKPHDQNGTEFTGAVPADIPTIDTFFNTSLPAAGYKIKDSESEDTESEGTFQGNGMIGRWRARSIANCPGAVNLVMYTQPYQGS